MIGVDYRHAIFQRDDEDDDDEDEDEEDLNLAFPSSGPEENSSISDMGRRGDGGSSHNRRERGMERKESFKLERNSSFKLERNSSFKLERQGSSRGGGLEKKGSFRLEKSGSLRNFLQKSGSLRLSRRDLRKGDDEDESESGASTSDRSLSSSCSSLNWGAFSLSWGNTSVSGDLSLSIASFAASMSSFQSGASCMETEANVVKLMTQIQERIDSRREKHELYQNRIKGCLELACARFEACSPNVASLVSMRRVQRLRDGLTQVEQIQNRLHELYDQLNADLQDAKLMAGTGKDEKNKGGGLGGSSSSSTSSTTVLVDVDLEEIRTQARQIEEEAQNLPPSQVSDDELMEELHKLVPDIQRRNRRRRKQQQRRRAY